MLYIYIYIERERERERERETERETERQRDRDRETETETERDRETPVYFQKEVIHFSTYARSSEKQAFFTPWYVHVHLHFNGLIVF